MGYPKHFLLAFGGPLGEEEQWTCSLRMASTSVSILPDFRLDQLAGGMIEQVVPKVQKFMADAQGFWLRPARLGYVKFNAINEAGHYIGDATHQHLWQVPYERSDTNTTGPFQISTAITLRTDIARGLAAHGRFFVPTGIPTIDQKGYTNLAFQTVWANAAATFINSLNDWEGVDAEGSPDVAVVSRGKKLKSGGWGEGKYARVNQVLVGNVLDTQRRRRRGLEETYVGAPVE